MAVQQLTAERMIRILWAGWTAHLVAVLGLVTSGVLMTLESMPVLSPIVTVMLASLGLSLLAFMSIPFIKHKLLSEPMERQELTIGDQGFLRRIFLTYLVVWGLCVAATVPAALIAMSADADLQLLILTTTPVAALSIIFLMKYRPPVVMVNQHFEQQKGPHLGPPTG